MNIKNLVIDWIAIIFLLTGVFLIASSIIDNIPLGTEYTETSCYDNNNNKIQGSVCEKLNNSLDSLLAGVFFGMLSMVIAVATLTRGRF